MNYLRVLPERSKWTVSICELQGLQICSFIAYHSLLPDEDPNEYVFEISQSCDGTTLAASLSNRTIALFDAVSLRSIGTLKGHEGTITDVAFDVGNPHMILSCSEDGTARGWDTRTGTQVASFDHGNIP
jgi:WD40 repeat protein